MVRFFLVAQGVTGALSGTVTDSSAATVAGAILTVTNIARGSVVLKPRRLSPARIRPRRCRRVPTQFA